ncbi:unnamed protein product, partial [Owenia fusiformis]
LHSEEAMAEAKKPRKRTSKFNIEIQGEDELKQKTLKKLNLVKEKMKTGVRTTNAVAIDTLLDFWIFNNVQHDERERQTVNDILVIQEHTPVEKNETSDPMFLTTKSSIQKFVDSVSAHNVFCNMALLWNDHSLHDHAALVNMKCEADHHIRWKSSPTLPNGHSLVNFPMFHGYITSGMLTSQYDHLHTTADFGHISKEFTDAYAQKVKSCMTDSCQASIVEESTHLEPEKLDEGISIMTDARHGWRKNANDCDVVCIGLSSIVKFPK